MALGVTQPAARGRISLSAVDDLQLAYAIFRFTLGVNVFFHGAMRLITGLDAWVTLQGAAFADSPLLPMWAVTAFLTVLPFVEVVLGALLALGLYTRFALLAGSAMIFVLLFGNLTRQEWGTVGNNMHYVLYYALLIAAQRYNAFALDKRRAKGDVPDRA